MSPSILNISRRTTEPSQALLSQYSPILAKIFANRGIQNAEQLTNASKALAHFNGLQNVQTAAQIVATHIVNQKNIIIVGDFDADGATSVALCIGALQQLGAKNVEFLVPNRFDFGYGLSPEIVEVAAQQNADLLITVDNGIACFEGVQRAKSLGIQVIVTDHHLPAETLPIADAIVNPNLPSCPFPSKNLAGVGVAFYLMAAVKHVLISQQWFVQQNLPGPNLANFLDLVALGTVADVVPLDQNNRILVHQGLQRIKAKHCRPGIQALLEVAEKQSAHICATDLGFVLGPRLNAAGRLDDMTIGIQCLLSNNLNDARLFAAQLDDLNRQRKEIESTMQQEAMAILAEFSLSEQQIPDGICLYQDDWHQGIIGILAGRVKDKYHRPTIVFAQQDDQTLKGSARSIAGLHIRDLLELMNTRHPDLIVKFGGHAMAAGLSLKTEKLPVFSQLFDEFVKQALTPDMLEGTIDSDGPLTPDLYSVSFAQTLQKEGPWGQGFPEPIFDDHFEMINQRLVGQKHLKMTLKQGDVLIDAIKFNADLDLWPNNQCKQVHVAFRLDINRFRGQTQVQLIVVDLAQVVT